MYIHVFGLTVILFFQGMLSDYLLPGLKNLKQFVLVVNRWANDSLVGFLASIKYWHTLHVNVWSFLLLFFLNNRGCVGVTS